MNDARHVFGAADDVLGALPGGAYAGVGRSLPPDHVPGKLFRNCPLHDSLLEMHQVALDRLALETFGQFEALRPPDGAASPVSPHSTIPRAAR